MTNIAYYVEAVFAITLAVLLFGSFAFLIWVIGIIIRDDIKEQSKEWRIRNETLQKTTGKTLPRSL